jgi:L-malate glycosyltransferase
LSQFKLFFWLLKYQKQDVTFYVNTLLPFGAALAGKVMGKKIIYHIHETSIKPLALKHLLKAIASFCAHEAVYVSSYLLQHESLKGAKCHIVYNALSETFIQEASKAKMPAPSQTFNVLMLCSLKKYKGVFDFIELAHNMPNINFQLVLNASQEEIDTSFSNTSLPKNLSYTPATKNVHPFYSKSHLVINLSHPDSWIETFGMTVLEAMNYGLPAVVPQVGGIAELIEDGINGYQISVHHKHAIQYAIQHISTQPELYQKLKAGALEKAAQFSINSQVNQIAALL